MGISNSMIQRIKRMYSTRFEPSLSSAEPWTGEIELPYFQGNADDGCIEMALSFGFEEEMKKSFEDLKQKISNNNSDAQTKQQTVSEEKNT